MIIDEIIHAANKRLLSEDYHAHPALSFSRLQKMGTEDNPTPSLGLRGKPIDEESDALTMGTLLHLLAYEPERANEIAVRPMSGDRLFASNTKAYGEFLLANAGKIIVSPKMMSDAKEILDGMASVPIVRRWHAGTRTICVEGSFFWRDEATGVECKIRPDRLAVHQDSRLVNEDLKSCRDPRPSEFRRDAHFREYVRRMAWYRTGLRAITDEDSLQVLLVCGKEYRTAALYMPSEIDLDMAEEENRKALARYAGGDEWASWEKEITVL